MAHLIRNYHAGEEVILSERVRRLGTAACRNQRSEEQAIQEALQQAEEQRRQAQELLQQAQAEAEALREEARGQMATLQAEAQARGYEEGYTQGIAEGRTAGEEALAGTVSRIQSLLNEVAEQRARLLHGAEDEVVALAMAIAEKVVGRAAQTQREVIVHNVRKALDELAFSGPFSLRLHPRDEEYLRKLWTDKDADGDWTLVADENVEPGGCVVICGPATVDARLSTQLKAIVAGLPLPEYEVGDEA